MTDTAAAAPAGDSASQPQTQGTSLEAVYARMQANKEAAASPPPEAEPAEAAPPADTPDEDGDSGSEVDDGSPDEAQDAPGEAEEPEEQDDEPRYSVKIDGQQLEVTLDELINGYQLGKASRQRMDQAAAQKRAAEEQLKAVESQKAEIAQTRQQLEHEIRRYSEVVKDLEAVRIDPEAQKWAAVDWEQLEQDDPVQANTQWARYQRFLQKQQAVSAEKARVARELQQEAGRKLEQARANLKTEIQTLFPQWSDPKVQARDLDDMAAYARRSGISDQELSGWLRGRDWKILHQAMLFERQQQARAAAKEPVPQPKAAPPATVRMVRPEAPRPNPAKTARATEVSALQRQAAKSGNLNDIYALMKARQQNKTARR